MKMRKYKLPGKSIHSLAEFYDEIGLLLHF